ncbi:MAG: hypothetical protein HDR43_02245 [Mycoplasma sp.]|nr:hypothetical protein [Mycoplasma sp.]
MSTNYNILLKSEKKLKELILSYILLAHEIHNKLWLDANKYLNENLHLIFDNVERRMKRSRDMEDELLDECIWTISKDDPRANHLRFIISIIYSTKDISRSCEYAQSIAKIIVRSNLNEKIIKSINPLSKLYLNYIEKILELNNSDLENKIDQFDDLNLDFEKNYEKFIKENRKVFENDEVVQYQLTQICRLIFSVIERLQSIFSTIFFSKNQSKTTTIEIMKFNKK